MTRKRRPKVGFLQSWTMNMVSNVKSLKVQTREVLSSVLPGIRYRCQDLKFNEYLDINDFP